MSGPAAAPITPLGPAGPQGCYVDDLVEVRAGLPGSTRTGTVRTAHFALSTDHGRLRVDHGVPPGQVDDDLAGLLAEELFGPGWVRGPEIFERLFTGVVRTSAPEPLAAWELFYRNTLARVAELIDGDRSAGHGGSGHGTIADYAPVYARAERELGEGTVIELGSSFGFLALRLAAHGRDVLATDVCPGTVQLLAAISPRLGLTLATGVADAARTPGRDHSADNVLAVHLLEHLEPEEGDRVVAEALRLARRRVILAVPLEEEADETWGHVRTVSLEDLRAWGAATGRPHRVFEDHGGWLVVDLA